jgi:hypothetical protein
MSFEVLVINAARLILLSSVLIALGAVGFLALKLLRATRAHQLVRADRPMVLVAALTSALVIGAIAFGVVEYRGAQAERHEALQQLSGISPDLDAEISQSKAARISFFHTQTLRERASSVCSQLAGTPGATLPEACRSRVPGD